MIGTIPTLLNSHHSNIDAPKNHLKKYAESIIEHAVKSTVVVSYMVEGHERAGASGVLISKNGYVLTAAHVIDHADKKSIAINFRDNLLDYDAIVIAKSKKYDIALLKIKNMTKNNVHHLKFAKTGSLKLGQTVYVIGHPLGLKWTVTKGIISNLKRGEEKEGYRFQTDATINFGSSGGPVINRAGNVVGIALSVYQTPTNNFNFILPVKFCREFLNRIKDEK